MPSERFLTVKAIAETLGIDQGKVLSWIGRGELTAIDVSERRGGRPRWRIPAAAWEDFKQSRSNRPTPPPPAPKRRRRRTDALIIEFY
ncbi:MAG: helix-turn-helix domain-containing protein [Pirellulaceae bacterium]|nr:helix-turn-helix domain-containing protein [Pirellulaceae bacterium]